MTLRGLGNWILDTHIFNLFGVILILLIIFGYLWLIYDLLFNSVHYPLDDNKHYNSWDSFEHKKERLKLVTKLLTGFSLVSITIYFFFTQ